MTFEWVDYLTLAEALHRQPSTPGPLPAEAALRTAISRAYYAAFHKALNAAQDRDGFDPTGTGDDHRRLVEHFEISGEVYDDDNRRKISSDLNRLLDDRIKADYRDRLRDRADSLATLAVFTARAILNRLDAL